MRKNLSGSVTVEGALVVPVILFVFGILLNMLFYYHDKNIVLAVAYDTASYGSYLEEPKQADLERYLKEQLRGKLLFFSSIQSDIQIRAHQVLVCCTAEKKGMAFKETCSVNRTDPQEYIRQLRKIQKIGEEVKQSNANLY